MSDHTIPQTVCDAVNDIKDTAERMAIYDYIATNTARIAELESRLQEAKSLLLQAHDTIFRLHENNDAAARNLITKIRLGFSGTAGGKDENSNH